MTVVKAFQKIETQASNDVFAWNSTGKQMAVLCLEIMFILRSHARLLQSYLHASQMSHSEGIDGDFPQLGAGIEHSHLSRMTSLTARLQSGLLGNDEATGSYSSTEPCDPASPLNQVD